MVRVLLGLGCVGVLMLGVLAIVRIRNAPEFGGTPLAVIGMVLAVASVVSAFFVTPPKPASSSNSGDSSARRECVRRQPISNVQVRAAQDWIDIFDQFREQVDMLEQGMAKTQEELRGARDDFSRANAELRDLMGRQVLTSPTS
jgi:septal ring factor EnvC (AmiA/AmiB activator)